MILNDSKLLQLAEISRDGLTKEKSLPRIYIFFSFDLVNSTAYKEEQNDKWPKVFAQFYASIKKQMKEKFSTSLLWKYKSINPS
ncbi:MAG TPA: hypothetical protein VK186_23675 [Candidatus Deferrimicrobium sp.]|nr:hypothetical protein [Candidatus Deferrimicrobium sp.]